jgi:hypothetical protein
MTKKDIESLTIGEAEAIIGSLLGVRERLVANDLSHPYELGKNYFIRTVTHHHTGRLVGVTGQELVLENAAWIADDGRLTEALATGIFNEVEMFPKGRVIIGRGSIIDASIIDTLPTTQK